MNPMKLSLILLFASSLVLRGTLGKIICEDLPKEVCAFSVASSGKRCVLENSPSKDGIDYQCKTSSVTVDRVSGYIETDDCMRSCGIDRFSVGISSDTLLDPKSTSNICSPTCYQNCPNIVDLYFNLAMGEGVYLPELCEKQKENPHRSIAELLLSGSDEAEAPVAPVASTLFVSADLSVKSAPANSIMAGSPASAPASSSAPAGGPSSSPASAPADGPSSSAKSEDESDSPPSKSEDKSDSKSDDKSDSSPSKEDESDSDSEED